MLWPQWNIHKHTHSAANLLNRTQDGHSAVNLLNRTQDDHSAVNSIKPYEDDHKTSTSTHTSWWWCKSFCNINNNDDCGDITCVNETISIERLYSSRLIITFINIDSERQLVNVFMVSIDWTNFEKEKTFKINYTHNNVILISTSRYCSGLRFTKRS